MPTPPATITPDPASGVTTKDGATLTVTEPYAKTDAELASFAEGSGLNGPYLADLLSACCAHERNGVALFRVLEGAGKNPLLAPKFAQFRTESEEAVGRYEELIRTLGGDPQYISPPARTTRAQDAKLIESLLLAGSVDEPTQDMAGVQAMLAASAICVANAETLQRISSDANGGPAKAALDGAAKEQFAAAKQHLDWATETMQSLATTQAKSKLMQKAAGAAEKMVSKVKDTLT